MSRPPKNETKRYLIHGRRDNVAPTICAGYWKSSDFKNVINEDGHVFPFVLEVRGCDNPGVLGQLPLSEVDGVL